MGADSGGDEKMSVEATWKLFAVVSMSFLAYAVLRPICCPPKVPNLPKPSDEPPLATIKVHPARLAFKLFEGEARYLSGPKRPPPVKKKKKRKFKEKLKHCVRVITMSNAIRDLAQQAKPTCDVPNAALEGVTVTNNLPPIIPVPPPLASPQPKVPMDKGDYDNQQPKNPQVFSARLPANNTHLNGGTLINRRVQLRPSQGGDEDEDDIDPCTSSKMKSLPLSITNTDKITKIDVTHHNYHQIEERRPSLKSKLKLLDNKNHFSKEPEVTLDVNKLGNHQIIRIS